MAVTLPIDSTTELREWVNTWIRQDATPAFQNLRMNTAFIGVADLIDDLVITGGGEPTIAEGTTAEYWRGDKTWQTLNKAAVNLSNVQNVDQTDATNLLAGFIPAARYGAGSIPISAINATGTPSSSTILFGDGTWGTSPLADGDKGDISVSSSGTVWEVNPTAITYAKFQDVPSNRIIGRILGGDGPVAALTGSEITTLLDVFSSTIYGIVPPSGGGTANFLRADGNWAAPPGGGGGVADDDYGDITVSSGGTTFTIDAQAVTFSKMQNIATARFIGRVTGGTGSPESLTGTQATTLLDEFDDLLKGLVPASGGGTTNFLRADGTWAAPSGGSLSDGDKGDVTVSSSGSVWTIDNSAITNAKINDVAWSKVTSTPTTVSGYGISDAVTLTGTQTLTNKTLTSPVINVGSDATGDVYYRNGLGVFTRLPAGTNGHVLTLASGVPIWAAASGSLTPAAIGSSPNANAMTYSSGTLTLQPASASFGGVVTTGVQVIAGSKELTGTHTTIQGLAPRLYSNNHPTERTPSTINTGGYNAFGITDVFKSGKYIIVYREGSSHVAGGVVKMRTSTNQGQTWSSATTIATDATYDLRDIGGGVTPSGRILIFYSRYEPVGATSHGMYLIYSDDEGATWSSATTISNGSEAAYSILGKVMSIGAGTLLKGWYGITGSTFSNYVIKSTDDGLTWGSAISIVSNSTDDFDEPAFEYLGGNTVLCLLRSEAHSYGQFISNDNGSTWTDQGDVSAWGIAATPAWLATYRGVGGRRVVAAYYRESTNIRAIYADALDLITNGVSAWETSSAVTIGTVTSGSSGYINVIHPNDDAKGFGWYYSEPSTNVADIKFVSLPISTIEPYFEATFAGGGGGSSNWTTKGSDIYRNSWVGLGDFSSTTIWGQFTVRDISNGLNAGYYIGGTGGSSVTGVYFTEGETFGSGTYASFQRIANANSSYTGVDGGTFLVQNLTKDIVFSTANPGTMRRDIKIDGSSGTISFHNDAYTFPTSAGSANQVLAMPSSGTQLVWATASGGSTTTINNNANNRIITGSGTANTLEAESNLTWDQSVLTVKTANSGLRFQEYTGGSSYFAIYADGVTPGGGNWSVLASNTNSDIYFGSNHTTTYLYAGGAAQITATASGIVVGNVKITGGSPGANKVLTSDADGDASWQTPTTTLSNTYSPTFAGATNVTSGSAFTATYTRVGNNVIVSVLVSVDPTSPLSYTEFTLTLPVASNLSGAYQLVGAGGIAGHVEGVTVQGDTSNDRAIGSFICPAGATNCVVNLIFQYQVI